eukprot:903008_1
MRIMYTLLLITGPILAMSVCPGLEEATPPQCQTSDFTQCKETVPDLADYNKAVKELDIEAVISDIDKLLTDSQDCWPADSFTSGASYGGLFIRLAWHCSGTFRVSDGAGGCAGGRQRFWPEASWDDNTNLDKARALLVPIKQKYEDALSWGDLFIFAGTTAILNMGGPVTQICAGRIDSTDGTDSLTLGPGPEAPDCITQGDCDPPLGTNQIGLIYVNPEGFMGDPDPLKSAEQIRDVFSRMGFNDRDTVALIGGGHTFGKSHGACADGAGLAPNEDPFNPWCGKCGIGKGKDTYTSGLEGQWTSNPLYWDNEYFELLINDEYELIKGLGDKYQWENKRDNNLMMFTTDLALIYDEKYKEIVKEFANDINVFDDAFANAWEILTTNGGKWADEKQCVDFSDGYEDKTDKENKKKKGHENGMSDIMRYMDVSNVGKNNMSNNNIYDVVLIFSMFMVGGIFCFIGLCIGMK